MKKEIRYTNEPMELTLIPDFFPPPEELRKGLRKAKVTLEVDAPTASVFREQVGGKLEDSKRMMGRLLNLYATRQAESR